ncbi:hypothetical protein ACJMK2_034669 [Sinanodonta woodiana]|uniref:Uncharacterized protein n=1 Tax=Sinanodonta woodiana TaxID=1069815 RepID=A0ABD3WUG3_SINWO
MYSGFILCSPDFSDECLKRPTLGKPVSNFCMMALSNLLKLYNHIVNLNCVFIPLFWDPEKPTITIMWTNINTADKNGFIKNIKVLWIPNHFVPMTSDYKEITSSPKSTKAAVRTDAESIRETILGSTTWLEDPAVEDIQITPSQSTSEMEDSHRDTRSRQMTIVRTFQIYLQEETSKIKTGRK